MTSISNRQQMTGTTGSGLYEEGINDYWLQGKKKAISGLTNH